MSIETIALHDYVDAFAVPGQDSIIDMRHPTTGLSMVYSQTLEEIQVRYPGAEVVNFEAWIAAKAERQHTPVVWRECPEARYDKMLNVLPPAVHLRNGFLVGEPWDHDAGTGEPRFAAFRRHLGAFEESNRPMTRTEFRRAIGG
jgi:hypothetical protein